MRRSEVLRLKGEIEQGFGHIVTKQTVPLITGKPDLIPSKDKAEILNHSAEVTVFDFPTAMVYEASYPTIQLGGSRFGYFLRYTSSDPYTDVDGQDGLAGALDDWKLLRRVRSPDQRIKANSKDLAKQHSHAFSYHWMTLVRYSIQDYIRAAEAKGEQAIGDVFRLQTNVFCSPERAQQLVDHAEQSAREGTYGVLNGRLVFGNTPFDQIDPVLQATKLNEAKKSALSTKKVVEPDTPLGTIHSTYSPAGTLQGENLGHGRVKVRISDAWAILDTSGPETQLLETHFGPDSTFTLSPKQVWARFKGCGSRMYLDGVPNYTGVGIRYEEPSQPGNLSLGLDLAAYLDQNFRVPARMKFPGTPFWKFWAPTQTIGAAQVSLAVSYYREKYLDGPFFESLEQASAYVEPNKSRAFFNRFCGDRLIDGVATMASKYGLSR